MTTAHVSEWLTLTEAAELIGVSVVALSQRIKRGNLRKYPAPAEWGSGDARNRPRVAIRREDALKLRRIRQLEAEMMGSG